MTRYHAHRSRPVVDALRVVRDGAAFLFTLGAFAFLAWMVTP